VGARAIALADEHRVVPIGKGRIVGLGWAVAGHRTVDRSIERLKVSAKPSLCPAGKLAASRPSAFSRAGSRGRSSFGFPRWPNPKIVRML